ncbi:alpha/beta hydrolase family protein [Chitinophaga niastensis]|uniref:Proline iminopeptidase n=1 Tax=Chitinophaga niastensis TaxID=536980 RepID=A0A2P8HA24_CHINA|nr:alpha/beta fold hydrolase [Chitinophaga niastensis]PSL43029.1 alpha/beta hydrolase family protein [Chitinophaga niastensis]
MKKILIISGTFSLFTFLIGYYLQLRHSQFADFTHFLCYAVFILVFLPTFFIVKAGKISAYKYKRNAFRLIRGAAFAGILILLCEVFWPGQYGSSPVHTWAGTKFLNLQTGSRIAYILIPGKGVKKPYPIFYLEGGPGGPIDDVTIRMMMPLAEEGYDIYLYDQIGCGLSGRLQNIRDYTADRHRQDLEEIVKKTRAEKVILIGQSWGTILGVLFAADNPAKVEKMVFTGPGPIPPAPIEPIDLRAPDSLHLRAPYYTNRQQYEKASNLRTKAMFYCATTFGKKTGHRC